jgi:hypothetical protein
MKDWELNKLSIMQTIDQQEIEKVKKAAVEVRV